MEANKILEIKNVNVYGLKESVIRAKYPMGMGEPDDLIDNKEALFKSSFKRAYSLGSSGVGEGHDNFLSGIIVQFDIKYPQYWTPEFQRYHFAQIISSQSKMHKLTTIGRDDEKFNNSFNKYVDKRIIEIVKEKIELYNFYNASIIGDDGFYYTPEEEKLSKKELEDIKYNLFMQCVSNLPMGYEIWMGITTNYRQLKTIYLQRENHKLKEDWGYFCDWCLSLPSFQDLTGV